MVREGQSQELTQVWSGMVRAGCSYRCGQGRPELGAHTGVVMKGQSWVLTQAWLGKVSPPVMPPLGLGTHGLCVSAGQRDYLRAGMLERSELPRWVDPDPDGPYLRLSRSR